MELSTLVTDIKHIYIYTRVSTEDQVKGGKSKHDDYGLGMQAQVEICSNFYNENLEFDLRTTPQIISDVGSTFNDQGKMVNFDLLLKNLPEKSLIMIVDVSRLGRNIYQTTRNYEIIEKAKSWIYSVNENKIFGKDRGDDLFFFGKSLEAESFSINKSSNTKAIFKIIKDKGGYIGGIPFGMRLRKGKGGVHKLERNPKQSMTIKKIITMYTRGIRVGDIEKSLANNNANNYKGKPIKKSLISRIVRKYKLEQAAISGNIANMQL